MFVNIYLYPLAKKDQILITHKQGQICPSVSSTAIVIHGINRINSYVVIEKKDMTLPNRVILKNLCHIWPDGQVYSMYGNNELSIFYGI